MTGIYAPIEANKGKLLMEVAEYVAIVEKSKVTIKVEKGESNSTIIFDGRAEK